MPDLSTKPTPRSARRSAPAARRGRKPQPVRILIADDHAVVRHGLRALLQSQRGWTVCGEAANGREVVALAGRLAPDVAIIDIMMPHLNGLEAARRLRRISPETRIVYLTMYENEQMLDEAIREGSSYLLKTDAASELVGAVRSALRQETFVSRGILAKRPLTLPGGSGPGRPILTDREREVIQLAAEGRSTKEIAVALGVSIKTADSHRTNLMRKLGIHSAVELALYAVRNDIIRA